jgi:hypothetical protein
MHKFAWQRCQIQEKKLTICHIEFFPMEYPQITPNVQLSTGIPSVGENWQTKEMVCSEFS